jgi:hypothetical protein
VDFVVKDRTKDRTIYVSESLRIQSFNVEFQSMRDFNMPKERKLQIGSKVNRHVHKNTTIITVRTSKLLHFSPKNKVFCSSNKTTFMFESSFKKSNSLQAETKNGFA